MAVILLADEIACTHIFKHELPLIADDVLDYMFDSKEIDVSNRILDFLMNFVAQNISRFKPCTETHQVDLWGKLDGDILQINKAKFEEIMATNNFPVNSTIKKWATDNILIKNSQGRYYNFTKLNNVKAYYYYIKLPTE